MGLSIRWKLFLLFGGLVTVVVLAFGGAAYRGVRRSALSAASQHLAGIAGQWARLFESSVARQNSGTAAAAASPLVRNVLMHRDSTALAAAEAALRPLVSPGQSGAVQLLGPDRARLLVLGDTAAAVRAPIDPALLDRAATRDSLFIGPLRPVGRAVVATIARRIMARDTVAGYLAQTTQIQVTPSPEELNRLFGGTATQVRVANRDGSLWTDLAQPIEGPSWPTPPGEELLAYEAASGPVFAAVRPIGGTEWVVVLEQSQAHTLAESRQMLWRLLVGGGVVVVLGLAAAIALSGSLTRPLGRLTEAVEVVASGDYTRLAGVPHRRDELGRLSQAFDTMVTRVQEAFAARRAAEDYYRVLFESVPLPVWLYDSETLRILAVNEAAIRHYGYSRTEFLGLTIKDLRPPEDLPRLMAELQAGERRLTPHGEWRHRKKDGTLIDVEVYATSMKFQGRQVRMAVIHDRTELRKIERQLQQAQKMEAIGQLAGGIAHDFNNLLTVILSYSELLRGESGLAGSERDALDAIQDAGTSAAALTRQLLIFSRQEVVQPRVMRLNDVVEGTGKMLTRLLGEHIELKTVLAADAGLVKVDPGQMEQVIVNLAVNARDAMPRGGRLFIESRNVELGEERAPLLPPGLYVQLVVSDNGIGMDAATQARIFEPFFTTKEPGKGTGLGLSTVYGIVKQSGGHIAVYSEPGRGTSFRINLPRLEESAASRPESAVPSGPAQGHETILVVEDEDALRELARRILEEAGYTVLTAAGGDDANETVAGYPGPIHLLVTDVVLPRTSGSQVAAAIAELRPGIRILYMSGYTDDAIVHHGVLEAGVPFIEKPFRVASLTRKVRAVLDGAP